MIVMSEIDMLTDSVSTTLAYGCMRERMGSTKFNAFVSECQTLIVRQAEAVHVEMRSESPFKIAAKDVYGSMTVLEKVNDTDRDALLKRCKTLAFTTMGCKGKPTETGSIIHGVIPEVQLANTFLKDKGGKSGKNAVVVLG